MTPVEQSWKVYCASLGHFVVVIVYVFLHLVNDLGKSSVLLMEMNMGGLASHVELAGRLIHLVRHRMCRIIKKNTQSRKGCENMDKK